MTPQNPASPTDVRDWPEAPCCIGGPSVCICGTDERVLRAYMAHTMPTPMTVEQREWCLSEIDAIEGWRRTDHVDANDADLACAVISAWTDYCQDKGLLE